jgi:mRNA interferase RelE/StbE
MTKYHIRLSKPARKFIDKQSVKQKERLLKAIYKLPHNGDIEDMSGYKNKFRLRVGNYRVVYSVYEKVLTVEVLKVGNRGDVYK